MVEVLNQILNDCNAQVTAATLKPRLLAVADKPADVLRQVKAFYQQGSAACSGWLCFTDKVEVVPNDFSFADGDDRILLSGELTRGSVSLHIRQSEKGWQLFELTRTEGGEMLMVAESFLSIHKDGQKLHYENYWHKVKNGEESEVYQPFAARFAGFEGGK